MLFIEESNKTFIFILQSNTEHHRTVAKVDIFCVSTKLQINRKRNFSEAVIKHFCKISFKNLEIKGISKFACTFFRVSASFWVHDKYMEKRVHGIFQSLPGWNATNVKSSHFLLSGRLKQTTYCMRPMRLIILLLPSFYKNCSFAS